MPARTSLPRGQLDRHGSYTQTSPRRTQQGSQASPRHKLSAAARTALSVPHGHWRCPRGTRPPSHPGSGLAVAHAPQCRARGHAAAAATEARAGGDSSRRHRSPGSGRRSAGSCSPDGAGRATSGWRLCCPARSRGWPGSWWSTSPSSRCTAGCWRATCRCSSRPPPQPALRARSCSGRARRLRSCARRRSSRARSAVLPALRPRCPRPATSRGGADP